MTAAETATALITTRHAEGLILAAIRRGENDFEAAAHAVRFLERLYDGALPAAERTRAERVYLAGAALLRAGLLERQTVPREGRA